MNHVALVGTPNSGKTSLFNWLTGRQQKVVNYPGSTVDFARGESLEVFGSSFVVYDSPGTYSLNPKSAEEQVTLQLLRGAQQPVDAVVAVLDSTHLDRQLPLVDQLKSLNRPLLVALTMEDLHQRDEREIPVKDLEDRLGVPVVAVDGLLGKGIDNLARRILQLEAPGDLPHSNSDWSLEQHQESLIKARDVAGEVLGGELSVRARSDSLDRLFLHPILGFLIFASCMVTLFASIFWLATPFMDLVDGGFASTADLLAEALPQGLFNEFLSQGIVASFGAVLVFVPQIFILFFGVSWLEQSGYLARAAAIVDLPLSWVGLTGRSFVPLLSGFACAVPAVMAARSVKSEKARWLTVFIIPFMTCSARLPVYALLISFLFFGQSSFWAGLLLASLYIGAIALSLVSSGLLSRVLKFEKEDSFAIELPIYRRPRIGSVLNEALRRTKAYIFKAGPIIFVFAVIIWIGSTFPAYDLEEPARTQNSYAAQLGQWMEPAFEPMGVDWRVGVSMISAFAAREVFVSSLAVVMNITESDEDSLQASLIEKMKGAKRSNGETMFTLASVAGILMFFMVALQCMSTVGVVIREMGSWKYAMGQLVSMNLLAYALAVLTYQTLKYMGFDS